MNAAATLTSADDSSNGTSDSSDPNKRHPLPSPMPSAWAIPADIANVRANTPLAATNPLSNEGPGHFIQPVKKATRSRSDASTKSTKSTSGGVFKRMLGAGFTSANSTKTPNTPDISTASLATLTLTPAPLTENGLNGQIHKHPSIESNGIHHPPNIPSRANSLGGAAAVAQHAIHPPTSRRSQSTDGRDHDEPAKGISEKDKHGPGQRFTLKELLGSAGGTKLARKSSASSRRSDSSRGDKDDRYSQGYISGEEGAPKAKKSSRAPSSVGESTAGSLNQKYGVCERAAIGKGATSVVRLAHKWDRSEEKLYAVKEFRKRRRNETEREYVKKLTSEFCISSTLHHHNIVETVDLVQDDNLHWCEVMEYCPGGDLYAAIKRGGMSPSEVECSFKQILTGVEYLHNQGVAHRDIKPENLFFDARGQLKIGDYGASTVYRLPWEKNIHMSSGLCGSEPYIAPEQFANSSYDARRVDIWACGIVYYCLHFQELPWRVAQLTDPLYASYVGSTQSRNKAEAECPPTINNLSPRACRPLLRRMLEPEPRQRILIEDVMKDAWVKSIEVCCMVENPKHVHVHARQMTSAVAA